MMIVINDEYNEYATVITQCIEMFIIVMEAKRSLCLYHPDSLITNFCCERTPSIVIGECLMPLCPQCIGQHTQYHDGSKSKPQYNSVHEILAEVQSLLYHSVHSLEQDKKRCADVVRRIQSVDSVVREKVLAAKTMVYAVVDDAFKELQKHLNEKMRNMHEESGVYSIAKSDQLMQHIEKQLEEMYKISDGLKSEQFLGNIIIFLKDKQESTGELHNKAISYLHINQTYFPTMEINNQSKSSLNSTISRMIKIVEPNATKSDGKHLDKRRKSNIGKSTTYFQNTGSIYNERAYTPRKSVFTNSSRVLRPSNALMKNDIYRGNASQDFRGTK